MKLYRNRREKAEWMIQQFKPIFEEVNSVLDVGCDRKYLKRYLSDKINYIGIDITGVPDIYFDLDKDGKLPFEDNSFDLVVCADVLEHLENIHFVFDELVRVSSKYILISLPNPASAAYINHFSSFQFFTFHCFDVGFNYIVNITKSSSLLSITKYG